MCDDDRCGSVPYGRIKHFSWMHQTLVERTDTDDVCIDNSAGTVKRDGDEMLSVQMTVRFEMPIGTVGIGNNGIVSDLPVTGTILSNFASAIPMTITMYGFGSHLKPPVPNAVL